MRKSDPQVLADHSIATPSGCIIWTGAQNKGYGKLWRDGKTWGAHRFAWSLAHGPIADGLVIDHLCRRPLCINTTHMDVTTVQINTLRGTSASAKNAVKTRCKRGHEFTPENTYLMPRGGRECRTCKSLHRLARRAGISTDAYIDQSQERAA